MTVLLLFTKIYFNKINIICTIVSVSACQGNSWNLTEESLSPYRGI